MEGDGGSVDKRQAAVSHLVARSHLMQRGHQPTPPSQQVSLADVMQRDASSGRSEQGLGLLLPAADAPAYVQSYHELVKWLRSIPTPMQRELHPIAYALLVHCVLAIIGLGDAGPASALLQAYAASFTAASRRAVLEQLGSLRRAEDIASAAESLTRFCSARLSALVSVDTFEALYAFLRPLSQLPLLALLHKHVQLQAVQPHAAPSCKAGCSHPAGSHDGAGGAAACAASAPVGVALGPWGEFLHPQDSCATSRGDGAAAAAPSEANGAESEAAAAGAPAASKRSSADGTGSSPSPSVCVLTLRASHAGELCATELARDAELVACGHADGSLQLCRFEGNSLLFSRFRAPQPTPTPVRKRRVVPGHSGPMYTCTFSADSQHVLSGGADGEVRLWSARRAAALVAYRNHCAPVWHVSFAAHNRHFLSCASDGLLRLFCTERLGPLRVLAGHLQDVTAARFHPNGAYALSGSQDTTLRMWDVNAAHCCRLLQGHRAPVHDVALSPDGRAAASASDDGVVLIWDLGSGRVIKSMRHDSGQPATRLAYDASGRLLASAAARQLCVWDAHGASQGAVAPLMQSESPAPVTSLSFVAGLPLIVACAELV